MRQLVLYQTVLGVFYVAVLLGCHEPPAVKLGVAYEPPNVPQDLEQFYKPAPNQKAFEMLADGEKFIDMHDYYLAFHQDGWEAAVSEFSRTNNLTLSDPADCHMYCNAMETGMDAYWDGYQAARKQITNRSRTN